MEAGRELDALVAEKVMGWTIRNGDWVDGEGYAQWEAFDSDYSDSPRFAPSTDIAAAWAIFEKTLGHVERRGHPIPGEEWLATIWYEGKAGQAFADTAPLAICLAALKVVGAEVPA